MRVPLHSVEHYYIVTKPLKGNPDTVSYTTQNYLIVLLEYIRLVHSHIKLIVLNYIQYKGLVSLGECKYVL